MSNPNDTLRTVLKIFDSDGDGMLSLDELSAFSKEIEYDWTEDEKSRFGLTVEPVSFDQVINAINYVAYDPYDTSDKKFYDALKELDKDGTGKLFIPELINVLKHSAFLRDNGRLDELLSVLPTEDNYLLLSKMVFNK